MSTKPTAIDILVYTTIVGLVLIVLALTILGADTLTSRPVYQNF